MIRFHQQRIKYPRDFFISLSIYQAAFFVQFFTEIRIAHGTIIRKIDFTPQDILKGILKVKKIVSSIHQRYLIPVKIDTKINIALIVEAICQNRTKKPESPDMETYTKLDNLILIYLDEVHTDP